jgi:DHA2 family methylenomycin A resistance protein-like MFS transporter
MSCATRTSARHELSGNRRAAHNHWRRSWLLAPPLTSTLLGSVEKSPSGIAASVLNSTRQTGSVLGVALFGSLAGQAGSFMAGAHQSLIISACLLLAAAAVIWRGRQRESLRS